MDSINAQQPEENYKPLEGAAAQEKIKELVEKANSCFFCTMVNTGEPFATRPMSVQKTDDDGTLWFLSASDSHKNAQLAQNPMVELLFQGSKYSDYLHLSGFTTISKDPEKIKELWNPMLKTWFTEGVEEARITVLKVEPVSGYYWDTKHNAAVVLLKRVAGAIMGKTLDDSIEGELKA